MFNADDLSVVATGVAGSPSIFTYPAGADSLATIIAANYFNAASDQVKTGDKILVSTSTTNLSLSGTFRVNSTTGVVSVDWDRTIFVRGQFANISAAASDIYLPVPAGIITQIRAVQFNAITVANDALTFSVGGVAITGSGITVLTSGTAGSMYTSIPTANNVADGTVPLKASSSGASTTACIVVVEAKIVCGAQV